MAKEILTLLDALKNFTRHFLKVSLDPSTEYVTDTNEHTVAWSGFFVVETATITSGVFPKTAGASLASATLSVGYWPIQVEKITLASGKVLGVKH